MISLENPASCHLRLSKWAEIHHKSPDLAMDNVHMYSVKPCLLLACLIRQNYRLLEEHFPRTLCALYDSQRFWANIIAKKMNFLVHCPFQEWAKQMIFMLVYCCLYCVSGISATHIAESVGFWEGWAIILTSLGFKKAPTGTWLEIICLPQAITRSRWVAAQWPCLTNRLLILVALHIWHTWNRVRTPKSKFVEKTWSPYYWWKKYS